MDEKNCRTSTPPVAPHLTSKLASALVLSPPSDSDRCLKVLYRVVFAPKSMCSSPPVFWYVTVVGPE
eukprot:scaffold7804_cov77-Skeletonema_dohrnii-CCMP3373.AAC.1